MRSIDAPDGTNTRGDSSAAYEEYLAYETGKKKIVGVSRPPLTIVEFLSYVSEFSADELEALRQHWRKGFDAHISQILCSFARRLRQFKEWGIPEDIRGPLHED